MCCAPAILEQHVVEKTQELLRLRFIAIQSGDRAPVCDVILVGEEQLR